MKKILSLVLAFTTILQAFALDNIKVDTAFTNGAAPVVARIGLAVSVNAGMTELLKSSIDEWRPDHSTQDSWPSRHTSWAYTFASIVTHETMHHSGWWSFGANVLAAGVGAQRVLSNSHFPKDVIGGMWVGRVSTEVGYALASLIFPGSRKALPDGAADWQPSVDISTGAMYTLGGGTPESDARIGMNTAITFTMPVDDRWGFATSLTLRSVPLYWRHDGRFSDMLNGAGIALGPVANLSLPWRRWSCELRALGGIVRHFDGQGNRCGNYGCIVDLSAAGICRISSSLAMGAQVGYGLWTMHRPIQSLSAATFTRVYF